MTTQKDIEHKKSFAPTEYFAIQDVDGTAIDLISNGWTAEINIRRGFNPSSPLVETFTTQNGKLILNISIPGQIDFVFDGTEFQNETIIGLQNEYDWDMQIIDGQSLKKYDVYNGNWTVRTNI